MTPEYCPTCAGEPSGSKMAVLTSVSVVGLVTVKTVPPPDRDWETDQY